MSDVTATTDVEWDSAVPDFVQLVRQPAWSGDRNAYRVAVALFDRHPVLSPRLPCADPIRAFVRHADGWVDLGRHHLFHRAWLFRASRGPDISASRRTALILHEPCWSRDLWIRRSLCFLTAGSARMSGLGMRKLTQVAVITVIYFPNCTGRLSLHELREAVLLSLFVRRASYAARYSKRTCFEKS